MENITEKLAKFYSGFEFQTYVSAGDIAQYDPDGNLVHSNFEEWTNFCVNNIDLSVIEKELTGALYELKATCKESNFRKQLFDLLNALKEAKNNFTIIDGKAISFVRITSIVKISNELPEDYEAEEFSEELKQEALTKCYKFCLSYIQEIDGVLGNASPIITTKAIEMSSKIKWNGSPAHLALLFHELANKGYIEIPSTRGTGSYSKVADLCMSIFEVEGSEASIKKAFTPTRVSQMSDTTKAKLSLPPLSEIK